MKELLSGPSTKEIKPFIGRQKEMRIWEEWLQDEQAPLRIFYISGMGGIGKSTLMNEMFQLAQQQNAVCIWLDGRSCTQTPVEFLEYVSATLQLELWQPHDQYPLEPLLTASAERRFVIGIDNYEYLSLLEGWIMKVFLPKLPTTGLSIILTSRSKPSALWSTNTFWRECVRVLPLHHFTYEEMMDFLSLYDSIPRGELRELAQASDGHPLALALTIQAILNNQGLSIEERMVVSQSISANLLREMTSVELLPMIDALIVLQVANQEILSLFLDQQVSLQQYRALQDMSFVRTSHEGLALHDVARMHLLRDLELREPKRLQTMRMKAVALLYEKFVHTDKRQRREIAAKMLLLCKDSLQVDRMYADLSVKSNYVALESIHEQDLPILHELLNTWCDYSVETVQRRVLYHQFLDEIVEQLPESIAVLRDADHKPIAMFIAILLYEKTSNFLSRFFPVELSECCDPDESSCDPDHADTYYAVLGAAINDHPLFTREQLVGLLTLDRLSLLGEGSRAVLVATNSNLKLFLQQLGFQLRPTRSRSCDASDARADVLELDLRHNRFGDWVMGFFPKQNAGNSLHQPDFNLSEKEVRKLLSALNDVALLKHFIHRFPGVRSGLQLQTWLISLLEHPSIHISDQDRYILLTSFHTFSGNPIAAAQACNMSRATYYRHLSKAISNFHILLTNLQIDPKN